MMQTIRNVLVRQYEVSIKEEGSRKGVLVSVWAVNRTEAIVRALNAEKFTATGKPHVCPDRILVGHNADVEVRILDPRKNEWSEWARFEVIVHDVVRSLPDRPDRHVHVIEK